MEQAELDTSLPLTLHVIAHDFFPPNILMLSLENLSRSSAKTAYLLLQLMLKWESFCMILKSNLTRQTGSTFGYDLPYPAGRSKKHSAKKHRLDCFASDLFGRQYRSKNPSHHQSRRCSFCCTGRPFLEQLIVSGRLPKGTQPVGLVGNIRQHIMQAPKAGINIFGLAMPLQKDFLLISPQSIPMGPVFM